MAAVDYFLKIDGIKGESSDHKHGGEIEIQSWSFGVTNAGSFAHSSGGGAGKAVFQDVHLTSKINASSTKLMLACATGEHIKGAILTCRKAGKDQQEFFVVKLSDILISGYQSGGHEGSDVIPTDQFSINFSKIELTYKEQKSDGSLGAAINAGYDLKQNKKV